VKSKTMTLGVNIDHVATLRQARQGKVPSPAAAAREAVRGGADQITLHLREDRRHIQNHDVSEVLASAGVPVNLEMALHPDIVRLALRWRPQKVCIVPEKRRELTTEGGLDVLGASSRLAREIPRLRRRGIQVSLFIDPIESQIRRAFFLKADAIEIHTGRYAQTRGLSRRRELKRIQKAARLASRLGLIVNAGHGLDYDNVAPVLRIPEIRELNIGYAIVTRAVFVGMFKAVQEMKSSMQRPFRGKA